MNEKIRLGVIGANAHLGWAYRSHLPAIVASPDVELTGVCTTRQESAEETARIFGAKFAFHDYRDMLDHPDIDAVAVVVRVPSHFGPTKDAIAAGKAVYTEWPLGRTSAEAIELARLAKAQGVVTATGLQSHVNPAFMYMRDLVESGFVGQILTCRVSLIRDGEVERPPNRTWQCDASLGANTLTIGNGHTLDALVFVAGQLSEVSSIVSTQVQQWRETMTERHVEVTSPDNILVSARLRGGGVASSHVSDTPAGQSGFLLEIYGSEGLLLASGDTAPQYCDVHLRGARGYDALAEMDIPARYTFVPNTMPKGAPYTVGQMYHQFARSIRDGSGEHPNFDTAVSLHHLVDAIQQSSDEGRQMSVTAP